MSASLTARSSGKRVEDLSQRTETSRVFANPDSTWTLDSYSSPQSVRQSDGSWADANPDLHFGPAGVTAVASTTDVVLSDGEKPTDGVSDLVSFKAKDSSGKPAALTLGWEGDLPKPALDGTKATYPDAASDVPEPASTQTPAGPTATATATPTPSSTPAASPKSTTVGAPGADLTVETTRSGFSHTMVLPERPNAPVELRYPLQLSKGLRVSISAATGAIEVLDAKGKLVFFAPKPLMWDSRSDERSGLHAHEVPVPARIDTTGPVPVLVLTPDQDFLDDPDTRYPVTVDPTWTTPVTGDTWVQTDASSSQDGSAELRVGTWDAGVHKARTYMVFPTSALNGKKILDAKIQMNNFWSYSCTPFDIYAQRVTSGWNASTLVWTNQPSATSVGQQPLSHAKGYSSACPAGNVYFPVTPIVQTWADTPSTNLGVRLVAGGGEVDSNSWRRYTSANEVSGNNPSESHLQVTYNSYPNTAGSMTMPTGQSTLWGPVGSQVRYINTRKPTFSAVVSDPDGGTVKSLVTLTTGTTKAWNSLAGTAVASGGKSTFTPTSTTPALTEGAAYSVDAWANDGSLSSKSAFRYINFTVDSTAPSAPTITGSALVNGQWTSPKPSSNTFTFTGASTDTAKFQYSKDGGAYADSAAATGTPTKATLDWVADGSHSLAVRSVDRAGNISGTTTFTYGAGAAAMTSPAAEAKSTDYFTVKASAPTASTGTVTPTVYWRPAGGTEPADFSATNGSKTGWTAATALPAVPANTAVTVNNRWSAAAAAQTLGKDRIPVLLDLQVCFAYSSPVMTRCTHTADPATDTTVLRLPHAFGQGFPTADAGPGQVALWTGEFITSSTDASVAAGGTGLEVSRSYSSFAGQDETSVFGPGWNASFDNADSGLAGTEIVDNTLFDGTIALVSGDGEALVYRQPGNGRIQDKEGLYAALGDDAATSGQRVELKGTGLDARLKVTDADGTLTIFSPVTYTANIATAWAALSVTEPGSVGATSFTRDSQGRITRILAPVPAGVTCPATGTLAAGCRALRIDYATTTTATAATGGDIAGQVKAIWFDAYNPAKTGSAGMDSVKIAEYTYDNARKLKKVTDARSGRATTYGYNGTSGSGAPLLSSVTPAGEAAYTLSYGAASRDDHSLLTVSRDNPSGSGPAIQTGRYVYGLKPAQANGDLPALTGTDVALWDQASAPTYGAAVFSADKPLATSDPSQVAGGDWKYASLTFTDDQGYTVNAASYGTGAWQISATDYDHGNTVRALTPAAIAAIRQQASEQGLPAGTVLGTNNQFATISRYNPEIKAATDITLADGTITKAGTVLTAAGSYVTDTWSPVKPTGLDGTPARAHSHTDYDQGAPTQGINLATGQPYNLATTVTVTTAAAETGSSDTTIPVPTGEPVVSTQKQGYDPIDGASVTGPTSGWTLGAATTTTTVMPNPADNQTTMTRFDAKGRVLELRKPSSNGADAGTTLTDYYTAGTGAPGCANKPEWAGLPCSIHTAEAAPTKPTQTTSGYTMFLAVTRATETVGSVSRTTDTTYLPDGQVDTVTTTATGLTGSTATPKTQKLYDQATGNETAVRSLDVSGNETARTATGYDNWGQVVSYKDASGAETTTTYTATGDPATVSTPNGNTTTYTYDGTDAAGKEERRGKATALTITGAGNGGTTGSFTAAYNAAGDLITQTMPGGITQNRDYDDAGQVTGLNYTGKTVTDGNPGAGPWIAWSRTHDVTGRVVGETTPDGISLTDNAAGYARTFAYDASSRLTQVQDRTALPGQAINMDPAEGPVTPCNTRAYTFDRNGNRTALLTASSGTDGACPAATTGKQWTYDGADRIQTGANNTGTYTYDPFGRQTLIPAADTPKGASAGNLTLSYYDTDEAHTITQAGTTTTFALDPEGRRSSVTTGTTAETNGYTDDADSPGWVTETNGTTSTTTRYESTIGGDLGLTITGTDVKISLNNPHQDIVATITVPATGDAEGIDSWADYDEYGNQTGTTPNTGPTSYGWVGTNQRATDSSGLILMGARLYNAVTGLFTSVDPVAGGNTTDYTYPQDPINKYDLNGQWFTWGNVWNTTVSIWNNPWFQVGLTVLSFAVPMVGAITFGYRVYRVVSAARSFMSGVRVANSINASRPVTAVAGRIWSRAWSSNTTRGTAKNGSTWYQNSGVNQPAYRTAASKGSFGRSSNLTQGVKGVSRGGQSTYKSFHVNHRRRWW